MQVGVAGEGQITVLQDLSELFGDGVDLCLKGGDSFAVLLIIHEVVKVLFSKFDKLTFFGPPLDLVLVLLAPLLQVAQRSVCALESPKHFLHALLGLVNSGLH